LTCAKFTIKISLLEINDEEGRLHEKILGFDGSISNILAQRSGLRNVSVKRIYANISLTGQG
jgi:hypothetical protein